MRAHEGDNHEIWAFSIGVEFGKRNGVKCISISITRHIDIDIDVYIDIDMTNVCNDGSSPLPSVRREDEEPHQT